MKNTKLLISLIACLLGVQLHAQVIKGGAFESWNTLNYENPNDWFNSNQESAERRGVVTVTKVTGATGSAIRLETKAQDGDTMPGYFTNTPDDPLEGRGGVPYTQKPDSIVGWYKCDIKSGDTALFLVVCKKLGIPISMDIYKFTGTVNNFTRFAFKINAPIAPDTVVIAGASSNAIDWVGVMPGSTITFDKLEFVGPGVTQNIPQGGFDNWTGVTLHRPVDWSVSGGGVTRTTGSYKGDYAVQLTTTDGFDDVDASRITNGKYTNFGQEGGEPYSLSTDTLMFWYKYTPQGADSGECFVSFMKNGANIYGTMIALPSSSNWTKISYAFNIGNTPDTVQISFSSSTWPYMGSNVGSSLIVDEVQFASSPLHTSIFENNLPKALVYPNPSSENINISVGSSTMRKLEIYDLNGKLCAIHIFELPVNSAQIDISSLAPGMYFVKAIGSDGLSTSQSRFVKE